MSSELCGSRISLISKKDIRYEGILVVIDAANSSVTLKDVTSWGTEGRVEGEGRIPKQEKIYESIQFRGQDIKDLHVHEAIEAMEEAPASPPPPPPPPPKQQYTQQQQQVRSPPRAGAHNQQSSQRQNQRLASPPPPPPPPVPQVSDTTASVQQSSAEQPEAGAGGEAPKKGAYIPPHKNPDYKRPSHAKPKDKEATGANGTANGPTHSNAVPGMGDHLKNRRVRGGGGLQDAEGEFDFQAALAGFDKAAIKEEEAGEVTAAPIKKYNKSSFFDEISCDAIDGRQRTGGYQERGLNTETFGATSVAFTNRRFQGRGGRGRGRGYTNHNRDGGHHGRGRGGRRSNTSSGTAPVAAS